MHQDVSAGDEWGRMERMLEGNDALRFPLKKKGNLAVDGGF